MIVLADPANYKEKEALYIKVRDAEGRVADDELVRSLPNVPVNSIYAGEWQLRKDSLSRLLNNLHKRSRGKVLNILDVGCGNGWMTYHLYKNGHRVTGVDLNMTELKQAERVFGDNDRLKWLFADVMRDEIPGGPFDIILFSASCQYFSNIGELTNRMKALLSMKGEIHLLDSIFYNTSQLYEAKARSVDYYSKLGYPAMAAYYFHHTADELKRYGYKKLYPGLFSFHKPLQWWTYTKH